MIVGSRLGTSVSQTTVGDTDGRMEGKVDDLELGAKMGFKL